MAVFPVGGLSGEMLCHLVANEGVPHTVIKIDGINPREFRDRRAAGRGAFLIKASLRELEELSDHEVRTENERGKAARKAIERGCAEILVVSLVDRI